MNKGRDFSRGQLPNAPTVSVLIPVYNGKDYLKRALDSVINQTYQDFEIIIIDDGSTDSTPHICDEYGEKYDFIQVFHQQNVGLLRTREKLLSLANGKYIFWLDNDDYYDHTLLEKAVNTFKQENADIVVWGNKAITPTGNKLENHVDDLGISKWKWMNLFGLRAWVWSYATRKELWNNYISVPVEEDFVDDIWITPQIVEKTDKIVSLGECLYFYDQTNMNSIVHTSTTKNIFQGGYSFYKILRKNLWACENEEPPHLKSIRILLVNAYCIDLIRPSLTKGNKQSIKEALKDLLQLFPMKKKKKFYLVQFCVIHGINFICRWYGRGRIKRRERNIHT